MKTYLVGGAVRDELLDYPVHERDWVVVGATPQQMLDAGYTQVGKDFPVFLHPRSKDEHALARTERKQGHGYTGFAVHCAPEVTLEEDLRRRDFTINAMARDANGVLVDPYGGQRDLQARQLRHVSEAFTEDPLRVLRAARFAARYAHRGFSVAPETLALMGDIVAQGELAFLAAERVWVEMERALGERNPEVFIQVLRDCGALAALLPEVDALFGVPQRADYHPEVDTGTHLLMVLQQSALHGRDSCVAFAALLHDLGKGLTAAEVLPSHRGHERAGLPLVDAVCARLRVPNAHRRLALAVCEHHLNSHRVRELRGDTLLKLLEATGALREEARFEQFLHTCEADSRGRQGFEERPYPQADYLRDARRIALAVTAASVAAPDLAGKAIGEAMRRERVRQLNGLRAAHSQAGDQQ
ncbi:MAG: tRNA nucleotidyltransferase (CCA-adding enzyme) [Halieaceae bacterium]|jgi:tRNA nucleotidyltransferase (CCA-adding enzyme)